MTKCHEKKSWQNRAKRRSDSGEDHEELPAYASNKLWY